MHTKHGTIVPGCFFTASGEFVYSTGSLIVLINIVTLEQRFYKEHTEDVTAIAISLNRNICASAQRGHYKHNAKVLIWDSNDTYAAPLCTYEKAGTRISSIDFSPDGEVLLLLNNETNTMHTVAWRSGELLNSVKTHFNQVFVARFNPFQFNETFQRSHERDYENEIHDAAVYDGDQERHYNTQTTSMIDEQKDSQSQYRRQQNRLRHGDGGFYRDNDRHSQQRRRDGSNPRPRDLPSQYTILTCGKRHVKFWTLSQVVSAENLDAAKPYDGTFASIGARRKLKKKIDQQKGMRYEDLPKKWVVTGEVGYFEPHKPSDLVAVDFLEAGKFCGLAVTPSADGDILIWRQIQAQEERVNGEEEREEQEKMAQPKETNTRIGYRKDSLTGRRNSRRHKGYGGPKWESEGWVEDCIPQAHAGCAIKTTTVSMIQGEQHILSAGLDGMVKVWRPARKRKGIKNRWAQAKCVEAFPVMDPLKIAGEY